MAEAEAMWAAKKSLGGENEDLSRWATNDTDISEVLFWLASPDGAPFSSR